MKRAQKKFMKMAEQATEDAYDEYEQFAGWAVKKGKWKVRIPIQDIELKDKKTKCGEWIEAYRRWLE